MFFLIKKNLPALVLALAAATPGLARAETVVVVSAKSPAANLSNDQVVDIFLGRTSTFPGGQQAVPIDQADASALRDDFYQKVAKKTQAQLKAHWSKVIFTGKGQPPKEAGDSAAVKRLVADNPNMIGYVDKSVVDATVKVVLSVH